MSDARNSELLARSFERRAFADIGHADHGWLKAAHHFSFAEHYDPANMGWGNIRVWNDDEIAPHSGFPPHPHRDMEIITYVRDGAISHRDSLGNEGRTAAGEVQVMSAGTGITHAEYNREDETTRLFQIWVLPRRTGIAPRWDLQALAEDAAPGFRVLASGYGEPDALAIEADARLLVGRFAKGEAVAIEIAAERFGYAVATRGRFELDGQPFDARDGLKVRGGNRLMLRPLSDCEIVMVDSA